MYISFAREYVHNFGPTGRISWTLTDLNIKISGIVERGQLLHSIVKSSVDFCFHPERTVLSPLL
jgi:hypothetical protein